MDSEDEGGFLPANYPTTRPGHPGQPFSNQQPGSHNPFQHQVVTTVQGHQLYPQQLSGSGGGTISSTERYARHSQYDRGGEEPLYAQAAGKSTWSQRRGFSEPSIKAPRPWHQQPQINNGPFQPNLLSAARLPTLQQYPASIEATSQPGDQAGHFGVDTEMIEERWIHMQEARRRQQLSVDHHGGGEVTVARTAKARHLHTEQLAATYAPESARQIYIQRKDGGFGFTLRHFIVYPPEEGDTTGPPISEPMDTIFVKFIKEGGPATLAGLQVGDRLISVNRESLAGLTYAQVVQLIQNTKGMLRLVVVPEKDDILQVYFSEIAQDPQTNTRVEQGGATGLPLHLGSGSSRDSSPFSSKASSDRFGAGGNQAHSGARFEQEPLYASVGNPSTGGSTEHVYAMPALAGGSSVSTLGSSGFGKHGSHMLSSKDSLNSDSSLHPVQTPSQQDDQMIDKIKKDCEKKKEFLEKPVYPPYLSGGGQQFNLAATAASSQRSPSKELESNPYGIASLANTMPPSMPSTPIELKDESKAPAAKNFFMDIYAKEVSKMQSASKSSAPTKKRNFDATQFNTYGKPLGYRSGGHFYETDSFSRNNFVIIGTRSLHCEPPTTYERPHEPLQTVCEGCYECHQPIYSYPAPVPVVPAAGHPYCPACLPVHTLPAGCLHCAAAASMTMSHPPTYHHHNHHHPPPPTAVHHHPSHHPTVLTRPSTLPGLLSHDGGSRDSSPAFRPVPSQTTPVHMHPDPSTVYTRLEHYETSSASPLYDDTEVVYRRTSLKHDSDAERNLRRISYLQATKDDRMDTQENETGIAPTHSIKKLKSIFSDKNGGEGGAVVVPDPSPHPPKMGDGSGEVSPSSTSSPKRKPSFEKAGSVTSMFTEGGGLKEGYLHCKVAVLDGKKANDRSWKSVYAVLKSKALYMYKDKKTAQENFDEFEEKPVKLAESDVEVANDYTKRKNVFRVKTELGSEYLFQAENEIIMKDWVKTIDDAAMAVIIDERKDNKLKKLASFRNRSPTTGQSPATKPRKPSGESLQPLVNKDKKNWKGKMVKQLKRMGGGGGQGGPPGYPEGGSIGVPLEECPLASEYLDTDLIIPYLVKLCCDIVTERGLEIVGIYRVPGNNAAVNFLTEQVNKGVSNFQLDDTRWQDVNVVSSLLKLFFRKLPDPLFTMDMYAMFIEASKIEQPNKRLEQLRRLLRDLPEIHYETLKALTQHLCLVAENCAANKMEVRNLAIVFGPTLVRTTDDNMVTMVTDMSQQCRIIESLLSNWEYFFADTEVELEVRDSDVQESGIQVTGSSNHQSVMLANLHKLEDAGKLSSPKGDVSAKDIVSSIISAANRKIKKTGGKKDASTSDLDELTGGQSRGDELSDSRRDSESVIHGALQIASAVPGLLGPYSTQSAGSSSRGCSTPPTPSEDSKAFSSRRGSRDSYSGSDLKRRGSLPIAPSKRDSRCSYTALVTTSSPHHSNTTQSSRETSINRGEYQHHNLQGDHLMEEEPAPVIIESGTEALRNGMEDNQQVIRGTLSLVNMNSSSKKEEMKHTQHSKISQEQYKYPFETYTGLQEAQSQRIKQFEAETKAMIHRSVEQSSSRTSIDEQTNNESKPSGFLNSSPSLHHNHHDKRSYSTPQLLASTPQLLTSITTPVPDTDPLTGGILLEDHYNTTDLYDQAGSAETTYLPQYRTDKISSMLDMDQIQHLPAEILRAFDTNKVAARGTLQRLKVRRLDSLEGPGVDTVLEAEYDEDAEMDRDALGQLSASFDKKLNLLLDPGSSSLHYSGLPRDKESSLHSHSRTGSTPNLSQVSRQQSLHSENGDSPSREENSQVLDDDLIEQLREFASGSKKELDDVRNSLLRTKKVKRAGRVDKNNEPEFRRTAKPGSSNTMPTSRSQLVLRQINNRKPIKRSDSLTKKEKTQLNLKTKEVEKENKVMKLKEQFEAKSLMHAQAAAITTLITQPVIGGNNKLDVSKIRKKLSDSRNSRIKRRHTVGGTKDFPDKLMNRVNQERTSDVCWDRLVPALSVQEVKGSHDDDECDGNEEEEEHMMYHRLEDSEERRLSLPDYGRLNMDQDQAPIESHV